MNLYKYKIFIYVTTLMTLLTVSACSNKSAQVEINMQAVEYLNPDSNGRASPVVVNIYQLADNSEFENASYNELTNNPSERLGNNLLDKRTVEIRPYETISDIEKLSTNAKYLGVVAEFRNINIADWKTFVVLPDDEDDIELMIVLESQRISSQIDY